MVSLLHSVNQQRYIKLNPAQNKQGSDFAFKVVNIGIKDESGRPEEPQPSLLSDNDQVMHKTSQQTCTILF